MFLAIGAKARLRQPPDAGRKMKTLAKRLLAALLALGALGAWYVLGFSLPTYRYESSDGGMAALEIPWKGIGLDHVRSQFERYRTWKGNPGLTLLRTDRRNWWHLNLWLDNVANARWRIPYAAPSRQVPHGLPQEMREWESAREGIASPPAGAEASVPGAPREDPR